MRVLVTADFFDVEGSDPLQQLRRRGVDVIACTFSGLSSSDLGPDVVAMLTGADPITADILSMTPNLRVVSRCLADGNSPQTALEARPDILVIDVRHSSVDAQAELIFGLMIALVRNIVPNDRRVRKGGWRGAEGDLLSANTVGIVGCDPVGIRVGEMAAAFGATVVASDPSGRAHPHARSMLSLEELIRTATIVSLHNNGDGEGHRILSSEHLAMLRPGSLLINCSNSGAVSEDDLAECLVSGLLRGAAVNTFVEQPSMVRLRELDSVILTPNVALRTREAQKRMEDAAASGLVDGLKALGMLA